MTEAETILRMIERYSVLQSLRKVGREFGISQEGVRQILLRNGVPLRWRDGPEINAVKPAEKIGSVMLQELVDGAYCLLSIDSARQYGLVTGGPNINLERCYEIMEAGEKRKIFPRRNAFKRFIAQNPEMFS